MAERGEIRNANYRRQLADFTRLRWGAITPTDLDGFIDFGGKLFVFFEGKHGTAEAPYGQRLALQRLCDASRVTSAGFIVRHETPPQAAIPYDSALIVEYRWRNKWNPGNGLSLLEGIERVRRLIFPEQPNPHAEWLADYEREEMRQFGKVS